MLLIDENNLFHIYYTKCKMLLDFSLMHVIISLLASEGRLVMSRVVVKENEGLDDALRRFKRQVSRNGTLAEARKREYYVKPGVRRKMKADAAKKANKKKRR